MGDENWDQLGAGTGVREWGYEKTRHRGHCVQGIPEKDRDDSGLLLMNVTGIFPAYTKITL